MSDSSSIISALKRLERAGSEDSRQTEKLRRAADKLADHVIEQLDHVIPEMADPDVGISLPRARLLAAPLRIAMMRWSEEAWSESVGAETATRFSADEFARMVSTGWLNELAEWLEVRGAESAAGAETLGRAGERPSAA